MSRWFDRNSTTEKSITIKCLQPGQFIGGMQITAVEAEGNVIRIHTANGVKEYHKGESYMDSQILIGFDPAEGLQ